MAPPAVAGSAVLRGADVHRTTGTERSTRAAGGAGVTTAAATAAAGRPGRRSLLAALDTTAVARGAAVAAGVGVVAAVASQLLDAASDDGSPLAVPLVLAALAGLAAGGWVAARACSRHPLTHATLAALVAVVVLLVVDVVRHVVAGDGVRWTYVAVWVLLALAAGLLGGLAALHGPHRRADFRP